MSSQLELLVDSKGSGSASSVPGAFWWKRLAIIWYAIAFGMPSLVSDLISSAMTLSRAASMAARTSSTVALRLPGAVAMCRTDHTRARATPTRAGHPTEHEHLGEFRLRLWVHAQVRA